MQLWQKWVHYLKCNRATLIIKNKNDSWSIWPLTFDTVVTPDLVFARIERISFRIWPNKEEIISFNSSYYFFSNSFVLLWGIVRHFFFYFILVTQNSFVFLDLKKTGRGILIWLQLPLNFWFHFIFHSLLVHFPIT